LHNQPNPGNEFRHSWYSTLLDVVWAYPQMFGFSTGFVFMSPTFDLYPVGQNAKNLFSRTTVSDLNRPNAAITDPQTLINLTSAERDAAIAAGDCSARISLPLFRRMAHLEAADATMFRGVWIDAPCPVLEGDPISQLDFKQLVTLAEKGIGPPLYISFRWNDDSVRNDPLSYQMFTTYSTNEWHSRYFFQYGQTAIAEGDVGEVSTAERPEPDMISKRGRVTLRNVGLDWVSDTFARYTDRNGDDGRPLRFFDLAARDFIQFWTIPARIPR
jgi:hypothetical protein